jgi:hypothetical protein
MQTTDSPESGRATGAQSRHHGNNENDTQLLPDPALLGNIREIIRSEPGSEVHRVFTLTSHFELITDSETLRFDEFWTAVCAQVRLGTRKGERDEVA